MTCSLFLSCLMRIIFDIVLIYHTGYIPGFNNRYGLPFMKAVEVGAKEWHEAQMKLRARRDAMRAHAERTDPRNLLSRARADNVDIEIDHGYDRDRKSFGIYASVAYRSFPIQCVVCQYIILNVYLIIFKQLKEISYYKFEAKH